MKKNVRNILSAVLVLALVAVLLIVPAAAEGGTMTLAEFEAAVSSAENGVFDGQNATVVLTATEKGVDYDYTNGVVYQFFVFGDWYNTSEKVEIRNVNFTFTDTVLTDGFTAAELQTYANDVAFKNCTFSNVSVSPWVMAADATGTKAVFSECEFRNLKGRYGIHQSVVASLEVTNCVFETERGIHVNFRGSAATALTITGNRFTGIADGYGAICLANDSSGDYTETVVDISNNNAANQALLRHLNPTVSYETIKAITDNNQYGSLYTNNTTQAYMAAVGSNGYKTLQAAIDAAKDGDTIEILKDQTLTAQHVIEKDITINGNGFELTTSTVQRLIWVKANVTINDLTVTNTYSGGRCIETRVGGITLNLNNVTLNATKGSTQALTVGGNAGTDGDVIVNLNGCHIDSGSVGYGIITFNPVKLTIENSSAVCGYGALYLKPADSSVGSVGSVAEVKNSTLRSDGRNDGYAFGTIIIQDNNITVNVDEKSELIATNPENSTGRQYAIMISNLDMSMQPAVYTGITVNVAGKITADYYISNLTSLENVIYVPAEYKEAIEAFTTYKYFTTAADNGLIRVWANHDHDLDKTGAVKETCTTDGNTDYYTCSICGKLFADEKAAKEITLADTVIEAPGHKIVHVEAKPSTCTEDGNEEYWYCEVCSGDKIYADKELTTETALEKVTIPAGHNYTSRVDAKAPTCTENGNVEYWACNDCDVVEIVTENGRVESTQEKTVIAAKGHTMTKVETKTPSCTDDGNIEYYNCSVCKKNFADEKGEKELATVVEAAKGHKLTKVEAKTATCTAAGNIEHYSCDGCKKLFADAEGKTETTAEKVAVAAKGHTEVAVAGKAATCTETGLTEGKKCSVCGTVTVAQKTIDALGHKLTKVEAKAATYTEAGNIEHYACACGKLFADDKGEKEITDVVIPQLIKVEEEKAEVSKDAVDNAIADAKEKAEETGKPVEVIIEVPKAPVVEKPEEGETPDDPAEKPEEKPQEVVKVELPVQALENVAKEEANLTVVMPSVTVTVDTDALKAVTEQAAGNTVTLVVEQVKEETLTEKQQEAVKQYDVAVTIKAEFICQETNEKIWTEDNNADEESSGSVTVKMPFTPAEGSKGSDYKVLYIADDGSVKAIDTAFVDGHLVFALEHFSEYVVVNTKTTSQTPNTGDNVMLTPVALLLTLSFAGVAVMVAGKKKLL